MSNLDLDAVNGQIPRCVTNLISDEFVRSKQKDLFYTFLPDLVMGKKYHDERLPLSRLDNKELEVGLKKQHLCSHVALVGIVHVFCPFKLLAHL